MARSVHDLPATGYGAVAINWSDLSGHLVDVGLVASGGSAYLRRIVLHGATSNANSVFNIGENDTEDGLGAGPDLTVAWETNPAGITLQEVGASDSVTLGGPNAPANTPGDPAEAYFWSYGAADKAALVTWLSSYAGGAVTLTLDDGVPVNVDHTVTASPANWTFDLPEASATKTAPPPAALALSDWSLPAGRTQEAAALITAGDELYRAGVEGSLDDGELTLDNAEITINRIRSVGSGAQLTLNKSGADSWDSILEGTTPPYADFQLHLQYGDQSGEIIVLDIDDLDDAGGSFARFTVPSADQGALDGIASGDAFILAFTRAASDPVAHTATASPASWTFDLPEASATRTGPDPVAHTVTASPASWTFDLPEASATKTGPVATLTLSDWSLPAGRTQEAAALITAGDELYRAGVEGSLDDGELTLDNAEITINRIRSVGFGAQLTLNQSGAIDSWSSILEGTMPPYADVQIHLQYGDQPGEIIVLDIDDLDDAGGSFARFDIPSADQGALDGIASGDAFILAFTRAASDPVAHTATASPASWTFDLPEASATRTGPDPVAHTVTASPASWTFDLPEASATKTGPVATLTLSDWSLPAGRTQEAAALITAGDELYRAGVEGSLDDGELTLDNAEITINRIRSVGFGAQLTLNQSGAIDSWSSILEGTMPPYADVQIHLQYGDQPGEIIVLDIDDLDDAGGSFARFDIPSADQGALDGIASGDAFILAVTRAASGDPVAHTATASPSRWTFDLPEASTARSGAHTANASPANWAFDLPEASATRTGLAYTATASPASWGV